MKAAQTGHEVSHKALILRDCHHFVAQLEVVSTPRESGQMVWLGIVTESLSSMRPSQIIFTWFAIILAKYLLLTFFSQWAWSGDYSYFNNLFLAILVVPAFGGLVYAIMERMGLSLVEALSAGQSDKAYTVTTYDGKVERGIFGDKVTVTPKHRETSDRAEMAGNLIFGVIIFDVLCFYFGWIQAYLPFLQIF